MNSWNDINLPGFSKSQTDSEKEPATSTANDDTNESPPEEVRIIDAQWMPGPNGFHYNEQCFLDVKVEFLMETVRKRLQGKLFCKYNGQEEDLGCIVEGFIDEKTNTARLNVKYLFFMNMDHYKAYQNDQSTKAEYLIKSIMHSRGANTIDSPVLQLPAPVTLDVEHLYHDNEPVHGAPFEVELEDSTIVNGSLSDEGKATITGLEVKPVRIRFKPDTRKYNLVNTVENTSYKASFSRDDAEEIVNTAESRKPVSPEKKGIILDSLRWVCGTLKGNFNANQTVSQIVVDAVIGMIPIVGDVTAVRDLIAVIIGLSLDEKKRNDKFEWVTLVLLLFALIPVVGGAIKGVGKLLLKAGKNASALVDIIHALNRIGIGDAAKFIKELDLTKYTPEIISKWDDLLHRLKMVIETARKNLQLIIPLTLSERLKAIHGGIDSLKAMGAKMIPEAVKELNQKLVLLQHEIYSGEWYQVPRTLKVKTREIEARVVETTVGKELRLVDMEFPPIKFSEYKEKEGWPDLAKYKIKENNKTKYPHIEAFSDLKKITIRKGTTIRRILGGRSNPAGNFWLYDLPSDGKNWREEYAVLEQWNNNGHYIEWTTDRKINAWVGTVASQTDFDPNSATFGQHLKGGGTQLFIEFNKECIEKFNEEFFEKINMLPKIPTNWGSSHLGINVPYREASVKVLRADEVASKGNLNFATASRVTSQNQTTETKDK